MSSFNIVSDAILLSTTLALSASIVVKSSCIFDTSEDLLDFEVRACKKACEADSPLSAPSRWFTNAKSSVGMCGGLAKAMRAVIFDMSACRWRWVPSSSRD